jgi:hypothetical protein
MPKVNINGVGSVNFPDDMSQADIQHAIETEILPQAKPAPMWKTTLNGIAKGAANMGDQIFQAPSNIMNLSKMAGGAAATALGFPDLAPTVTAPTDRPFHALGSKLGLIKPENEPTSSIGRVMDTAGQMIGGGGINPAQMGKQVASRAWMPLARDAVTAVAGGMGAGLGIEGASKIDTGNQSVNAALQAAGGIAGGMAGGMVPASMSTAGERVSKALKGFKPDYIAQAQALQTLAAQKGSPITAYEAYQGQRGAVVPEMQTQQRIAEQSPNSQGTGTLGEMLQNRPGANNTMMWKAATQIAPVQADPSALAGRLKAAAGSAINTQREAGNTAARSLYKQAEQTQIPGHIWDGMMQDPGTAQAINAARKDPLLGAFGAEDGSVKLVDAAKRLLDAQAGQINNPMAGSLAHTQARGAAASSKLLKGIVDSVVPEYGQARAIVAKNMQDHVVPMQQGQVGKLAEGNSFGQQANSLLPEKPLDITPATISNTVAKITAEDPAIVKQFIGQHIRNIFNESNQTSVGVSNIKGGANFAHKIEGNPAQGANLAQALKDSGANAQGLNDAIQIFKAQGYKPSVSAAENAGNVDGSLGRATNIGDILHLWSVIPRGIDTWKQSHATKTLAPLLADPQGVTKLSEMARTSGTYNPMRQLQMAASLRASQAAQDAGQ